MHEVRRTSRNQTRGIRATVAIGVLAIGGVFIGTVSVEAQQETPPPLPVIHQPVEDAWWTGPMLAPSAATLPRGHFLIEPYLFDVIAAHSNGFGSLTYVNYGLADKLTVGLIPTAGFNKISNGPSSSEVGLGDVTIQAQYRLAQFHVGNRIPTTSVAVQETLPTGELRPVRRPAERRTWQRCLHYDVRTLLPDLLLVAEWPNSAHAVQRIAKCFEQPKCGRRQCLRHASGFPRTRQARRFFLYRLVLGIQPDAEVGTGARRDVPPQLEQPCDRI